MPIAGLAQTQPVIFEAEDLSIAVLGSDMTIGTTAGATYVTTTVDNTANPTPERINTYTITFPAPGNYELYARYLIGPGGANDDSWYYGQGFGNNTSWSLLNSGQIGFNLPSQTVYTGGTVGSNVFRWVKVTGAAGQLPAVWTVPAGQLTQTFYWSTREDGMLMDKFAFGRQGSWYTVNDLDTGGPATGAAPPTPPPVPPPYTRVGDPLAKGQAKFLGSAHSAGLGSLNFSAYWNQVTPENGGKWGTVEATRDVYNFTQARAAYEQAKASGVPFKWHVLFWGNQQPNWLYNLSPEEQLEEIHEWLAAIRAEFPDLEQIEVVNEPLHDPPDGTSAGNTVPTGGSGNYYNALGGAGATGWDWIINAFTLAREYFPNAKLMLNDYSITNDGNATTRYIEIINLLKARGLIDYVGIQGHAFEFGGGNPAATHAANLTRLAALNLPVYVTEFDIDGVDAIFGVQDDAVQLARFQQLFPVFWEHPAVRGVTLWGYVQGPHWRTNQGAWLMYPNGAERPALQWLVRYVENKLAVINAGQKFTVNESVPGGSVVGVVRATDSDPDTVLSQWQINSDPSGKFAIDPDTGALRLAPDQSLDFETFTSHTVGVSVWDGYRRSAVGSVTVKVTNANDNAPVIDNGGDYRIDGGYGGDLGVPANFDADDTNQPGFSRLNDWKIVGGNGDGVFTIDGWSGDPYVKHPLAIDWKRTSYTLVLTVGDGVNTSAPAALTIRIPNKVTMCVKGKLQQVPKDQAFATLRSGGFLGMCSKPR